MMAPFYILPFPSPMRDSESEVAQSCLTLSDPMDCSPPGSSVHGISQASVLEWGAIAFSNIGTEVHAFHNPHLEMQEALDVMSLILLDCVYFYSGELDV